MTRRHLPRTLRGWREWFLGGPGRWPWRPVILNDPCAYCGQRPAGTVDHIDPAAVDPDRGVGNQTAACVACNRAKADRPLLLFLLRRRGVGWPGSQSRAAAKRAERAVTPDG